MSTSLIICWKPKPQHLGETNEAINRAASCHAGLGWPGAWCHPRRVSKGRDKLCIASSGTYLPSKPHLTIAETFPKETTASKRREQRAQHGQLGESVGFLNRAPPQHPHSGSWGRVTASLGGGLSCSARSCCSQEFPTGLSGVKTPLFKPSSGCSEPLGHRAP